MIGASAAGTSLSVTGVRSAINGGDGFVNIGDINAPNIDLGAVRVRGDLGQIDAGDAITTTAGLASLLVQSLGRFGISTQAAGGDLETDIQGPLGSLTVK